MARRSVVRSVCSTDWRRDAQASQPSECEESCAGFLRKSHSAINNQISERVTAKAGPRIRPGFCALSVERPGGFVVVEVVDDEERTVAIGEDAVAAEFFGPLEGAVAEVEFFARSQCPLIGFEG